MINSYRYFLVSCFFAINSFISGASVYALPPDTVAALVIDHENPIYEKLNGLSGGEIITLIDSLLDTKSATSSLLHEINDYAEQRLLKHDYYNSLTNFYDNSEIPSNSTYKKWDTKNILPYDENISKHDTIVHLTLTDPTNNCIYYPPLWDPVVTSNFGYRNGRNHNGIDLDLEVWDPVYAAFDGMVRIALYHPGYGRVVIIRHYNGLETLYAHLHRIKVKTGSIVSAGQVIGLGGSSGRSSGSHLHFEARYKGKPLNPKHLISFEKNKLISGSIELVRQKWNYTVRPKGVRYHKVKKGDFLIKIASRYGLSVKELCDLNGIQKSKLLAVGKELRVR